MDFPITVAGAFGWLVGGLGIFLFGIHMLSVGVRDASGEGLRRVIAGVTRFPPAGLLVGAVLTGLMQSSSAFSVMVVSFVQAGLLTFRQSVPLILGSAIGSTVTAQLLSKVMGTNLLEVFSLPMAGAGLLMVLFAHRRRTIQMGKIIFGFGAVFLGFIFMQGAVSHWQDTVVRDAFTRFSEPGVVPMGLGLLAGAVVTAIVQSSGATIGILQSLGEEGVVPSLAVAIPIVIGCQIGTAVTAVIASIGTNVSARRVAALNVLYRVLGGVLALVAMSLFVRWIPLTSPHLKNQIANFHTLQSIMIALFFLPLSRPLAWVLEHVMRGREEFSAAPRYLDYTGRSTVEERVEQAHQEVTRLVEVVSRMPSQAVGSLLSANEKDRRLVLKGEDLVDALDETISGFLLALERDALGVRADGAMPSGEQRQRVRLTGIHLLQVLHHGERVADHAENIAELARFDRAFLDEMRDVAGTDLLALAERVGELAAAVVQCLREQRQERLEEIATVRAGIRRDCRQWLETLHEAVSEGQQSPIVALLQEEIIVNVESSANHLRKAANASFGRPMQPTPLNGDDE